MNIKKIMNKEHNKIEIAIFSISILFITLFLYIFYSRTIYILALGCFGFVVNTLRICYDNQIKFIIKKIIQFRYLIALIIFIVCLIFRLHGSSVSVYNYEFSNKIDESETGLLIGEGRGIRGDEFNVQLPYYFSQYYNDYEENSYQMSLAGQDMILGYNAPVKDFTMIGKPFTIGYILFGNEIGLSWYWCSKLILFILVAFELCKLLTEGNDKLSLLGTFLIVFSPSMQWWFSPHMYDVFFWASTLLVVGYYFFTASSKWLKNVITILVPCCIIGFVIALFPSCQIPLGLIAIALLVTLLIRNKDKITFKKIDFLRIVFAVLVSGVILGNFLINSFDQINLLYNTVYPGKRICLGGEYVLSDLFTDITNFLTPYKNINVLNNCEVSTFVHLGVFFLLYFPFIVWKRFKEGKSSSNLIIGSVLFGILIIQIYFMLVGFPEWLAKITLFSYINRMKIVYGFTSTLFTIWSIDFLHKNKEYRNLVYGILVLILFAILYYNSINPAYVDYILTIASVSWLPKVYFILAICSFLMIAFLTLLNKVNLAIYIFICMIVISGFTINPIAYGASAIYNHPISTEIEKIIESNDSNWIALDSLLAQNFLLANGAKVVNSVNFYPDYGKWERVDANKQFDDVYNRYAHMTTYFVNDNFNVSVFSPDHIHLFVNFDVLKKWEVKYILANRNYDEIFNQINMNYEKIYIDNKDNHIIYKLNY